MTWYKLECVDLYQVDATKPALICLEDVSAIGPEEKRMTYMLEPKYWPSQKLEYVATVTLKNGHSFMVRPAEAQRLKEELKKTS